MLNCTSAGHSSAKNHCRRYGLKHHRHRPHHTALFCIYIRSWHTLCLTCFNRSQLIQHVLFDRPVLNSTTSPRRASLPSPGSVSTACAWECTRHHAPVVDRALARTVGEAWLQLQGRPQPHGLHVHRACPVSASTPQGCTLTSITEALLFLQVDWHSACAIHAFLGNTA